MGTGPASVKKGEGPTQPCWKKKTRRNFLQCFTLSKSADNPLPGALSRCSCSEAELFVQLLLQGQRHGEEATVSAVDGIV